MPRHQVKKVVAVCFVEAAKLTLEHLGAHRMQMSPEGLNGNELTRLYGEVRRLRDQLQRSVNAFQDLVDLDLAPADGQLLVACCRRAIEEIEVRMGAQKLTADEKHWLQRKRQVLADWAVELTDMPLLELPLDKLAKESGEAMRALMTRLQAKAYGEARDRQKMATTNAAPTMSGVVTDVVEETAAPPRLPGVGSLADAGAKAPRTKATIAVDDSLELRDEHGAPPVAFVPPAPAAPTAPTSLLDHRHLRDPRLRALAAVDLHAYERLLAAGDFRLATVTLASIAEAALLDHTMPRRSEFGLTGAPDSWKPQELLLTVLGDRATPKDHALAFNLFAARNLLRPALQMMTPAVVTADSFERARDLVQRTLHAMGFAMADAAPDTNDLLAGLRAGKSAQ